MKKDMVKHLFELYSKLDPGFQAIFEVEYPKLTEQQQLLFLSLLADDLDDTVEMLQNLREKSQLETV